MKRHLLAALLCFVSAPALAVCPSPLTGKDAAGATQNFGVTVDGSGNCYGNVGIVDGSAAANKATVSATGALKVDNSAVTQPVSGSVTVTQGTAANLNATVTGTVAATQSGTWTVQQGGAPWSDNITQFGGVALSTGTGAGGAGIPRVTVSNDSKVQPWDGTTTVTVKAASAAAAQTDTALVVRNPDEGTVSDSAYAGSGNASTIAALKGIYSAATAAIPAGTNTIGKVDILGNSGAAMDAAGQNATSPANELVIGGQFNTTPTTITSGNVSPLQLDSAGNLLVNVKTGGGSGGTSSSFGATFPGTGTAIGVKNGANMVNLTADASSNLNVNCTVGCAGGAFNNNSDAVATSATNGQTAAWLYGFNGTTFDRLRVDASKNLNVNLAGNAFGTLTVTGTVAATQSGTWTVQQGTPPWTIQGDSASGATNAGNPVKGGGAFNTTQPTVTNGQTVDAQYTARGAAIVATGVDAFTVGGTVTAAQATAANLNATVVGTGTFAVQAAQSGTWTVAQGGAPWSQNVTQIGGNAITTAASGTQKVGISGNAGAAMDAAGQNATSPANELLTGCQFNTAPTTITSGNISPVQCDNGGKLLVDTGTVTVTGTVAATQSTSPWVDNVTQFGGTNVSTGTGAGGAGIPRVTVSNDSQVKVWDGTNTGTVKASGTNAATTDTALVVAQSPNPNTLCTSVKPINQTASTDLVTSTNKLHICSVILVSASAQNLSLVEGTGTTCATGTAALIGGTTASLAVAANGGFSAVSDRAWLPTQTTADHLCLLQSAAGNVSGVITYTDHN